MIFLSTSFLPEASSSTCSSKCPDQESQSASDFVDKCGFKTDKKKSSGVLLLSSHSRLNLRRHFKGTVFLFPLTHVVLCKCVCSNQSIILLYFITPQSREESLKSINGLVIFIYLYTSGVVQERPLYAMPTSTFAFRYASRDQYRRCSVYVKLHSVKFFV